MVLADFVLQYKSRQGGTEGVKHGLWSLVVWVPAPALPLATSHIALGKKGTSLDLAPNSAK